MTILGLFLSLSYATAHPIFPKSYASLADRAFIHEVRARVNFPTPEDLKDLGVDWPLSPEVSRAVEAAIEREFVARVLVPSHEGSAWSLPYLAARLRVEQAGVARRPAKRRGRLVTKINAHVSLVHIRTGLLTVELPLVFEWRSAPLSDARAKMVLTRLAGHVASRSTVENAANLARRFDEVLNACAAWLATR